MVSGEDRTMWFLNGLKLGEVFLRFLLDTTIIMVGGVILLLLVHAIIESW